MAKFAIIEKAKRTARMCFCGIAIPCDLKTADGGVFRGEKVLKFNRAALRNMGKNRLEKVDPRYNGGEDKMIVKVGEPGSPERVAAMIEQYAAIMASGQEISIFADD